MKDFGKAVHALFEDRLQRFRRHVAAGEAGAAGGDHHVDFFIPRPGENRFADFLGVVGDDGTVDKHMAGLGDAVGERLAGFVVGKAARVGNGEHRDPDRNEAAAFVDPAHASAPDGMLRVAATNQSG